MDEGIAITVRLGFAVVVSRLALALALSASVVLFSGRLVVALDACNGNVYAMGTGEVLVVELETGELVLGFKVVEVLVEEVEGEAGGGASVTKESGRIAFASSSTAETLSGAVAATRKEL